LLQRTVVDVSYACNLCSVKRQAIFEKYLLSPCWYVDSDRNGCITLSPTQEKFRYLSFN